MIEIVPNWHPVLVHFTIALLIVAPLLFFASTWLPMESPAKLRLLAAARYNLLLGFIVSLGTVAAGWYAANTVAHDEAAHAAMLMHRNLALVTVAAYTPFVIWTLTRGHGPRSHGLLFAVLLFLPMVSLTLTAWRGGELVYVHGLGVQSLPDAGEHRHGDGESSHTAVPEPGDAETRIDGAEHDHGQEHAHDEAPQP
ncbi:MAG: DUF2231 domain-containing protein [Gammaproteobacteria bacterium]